MNFIFNFIKKTRIILSAFILFCFGFIYLTEAKTAALPVPASTDTVYYIANADDWNILHSYLPTAKLSGTSIWVGLNAPSESPSLSEPYKLDYMAWAKEIAALSVRYSNIKGFGIKDHQRNIDLGLLRQSYVDSTLAAARSINPQLSMISIVTSTDVTAPSVPALAAVFTNKNINPSLPRYSPFGGTQESWGANWYPSWPNTEWALHVLPKKGAVVENPAYDAVNYSPSVFRVNINYNDDYTGLASTGTPRAEIFNNYNFFDHVGDVIKYRVKIFIPKDFQWDNATWQQAMDINQLWLMKHFQIYGTDYRMELQDQSLTYSSKVIGSALEDVGKWVQWEFEFRARKTDGGDTYFIIRKNGKQVYSDTKANLRPGGTVSNIKFGMYKSTWRDAATKVSSLTLYFDDIELENVTTGWKNYIMDFGKTTAANGGGTSGDSVAHYVDLSWANPSDSDHDSTYIYSSLSNSTTSAVKVAAVTRSTTSYRYIMGNETTRYFWIRVTDKSGNLSGFCPVASNSTALYSK
jgi:hypothetical protein